LQIVAAAPATWVAARLPGATVTVGEDVEIVAHVADPDGVDFLDYVGDVVGVISDAWGDT